MQQWCRGALTRADIALTTTTVHTRAGHVHLTSAGAGPTRIVLVPGTGFNAAVALAWLRTLSAISATTVVDLPGQPGLSDPRRPRRGRAGWYGRALDEVLAAMDADEVVVVGNSLGAAVALAAGSARIAGRVLVSPASIIRLRVDTELALASTRWLLRPTPEHTRRMLRLFVAPGEEPPGTELEWMVLMGPAAAPRSHRHHCPRSCWHGARSRRASSRSGSTTGSCPHAVWCRLCGGAWGSTSGCSPASAT